MARKPRIEYLGAFYHVIVRGNQKQDIFLADEDRQSYLNRLEKYVKEHGAVLYAWVLMSNHVHLLLETPRSPISKIMQVVSFTYTRYFNRKYGKVGHLFQGRYKAFLCDRDAYLLELVRYIHLNPVRAGMVQDPSEYRWSSHLQYLADRRGLANVQWVLRLFSENLSKAKALYRQFVLEAIGHPRDESFYAAVAQQIVGNERFVEEVGCRAASTVKPHIRAPLAAIVAMVTEATGISEQEMAGRGRSEDIMYARKVFAWVCRESGYKLTELRPVLKRDLSVLSRLASESDDGPLQRARRQALDRLNARLQA